MALQHIISTALLVGDFDTALLWLEGLSVEQIAGLTLPDQRTPLHHACQHGRVDVAQRLITNCQCSIESKDEQGCTPLHTAAQYGQVELLKFLLHWLFNHEVSGFTVKLKPEVKLSHTLTLMFQQKLSDRHRDKSGNTPLHTACVHGQLEIVQFLTHEIGCDPNNTSEDGLNCLHLAAQHGHLPLLRYLIEEVGSDVNLEDEHGRSPTYLAAGSNHLDVLEYLIGEKGADPHFKTSKEWRTTPITNTASGRSLVHTACREGHLHLVWYLIDHHGCNPSSQDCDGVTPLYLACHQGHMDIVSYLITEAHCDPNCTTKNGRTCLHAASHGGKLEIVKFLHITSKREPKCDAEGNTPLHFASSLDVSKYLIEVMKCDPNSRSLQKRTPLHLACTHGHLEVVRCLVDTYHCSLLSTDEKKLTPLHFAAAYGHLEVVQYFALSLGCNPSVRATFQWTPLHYAAASGHLEVAKFLVKDIKCDPNIADSEKRRPLFYAIYFNKSEVSKFLIDHMTDIQFQEAAVLFHRENFDILNHCCFVRGYDPYVLLQSTVRAINNRLFVLGYDGVQIVLYCIHLYSNVRDNQQGSSASAETMHNIIRKYVDPLHHAAITGDMETVRCHVEKKQWDPRKFDRHGNNVLHNAAKHGQLDVVKYLTGLNKDHDKDNIEILCDPLVKSRAGLTAQDIASQKGHHHVVSYLLRATSKQPLLQQDVISPPINLFVVGNSGSGKSTLVKALSTENSILGRVVRVKGVTPLTAGIVPTTIHSQVFGKITVYDFAGHEEYYASHEAIFRQTARPIILVTVDISLSKDSIQKQLLYWVITLANSAAIDTDVIHTMHVVVIGSHADQVKSRDKGQISEYIASLADEVSSLKYHGFIQCDCRYSISDDLNQLRQKLNFICRHIRFVLAQTESHDTNRLCASMMYHLKHNRFDKVAITVSELCKHFRNLESPTHDLAVLTDKNLLIETCKLLSCSRHLLLLPHDEDIEQSLLILDETVVLSKVHACLGDIKNEMKNEFGVLEESVLEDILQRSLGSTMEPKKAIQYLVVSQFCTQISASQLFHTSDNQSGVTHFFFPNLVLASRPSIVSSPEEHGYTHLYSWCLKCARSRQFFTHRFLHALFVQLTKCEGDAENAEYDIWKNGILIVHNNGTRSIIEVTEQTTQVHLAIQCRVGCEFHLVKQRSMLISRIKSLVQKICPAVAVEEFLLLPQATYPPESTIEIPVTKVILAVKNAHKCVSYRDRNELQQVDVKSLLYFDSCHDVDVKTFELFVSRKHSTNAVPSCILREILGAIEACDELARTIEKTADITYQQLYKKLIQYSIFTYENINESDVSCFHTSYS